MRKNLKNAVRDIFDSEISHGVIQFFVYCFQRLCPPEKHFPLQAKEDTKELWHYFFEKSLTASEILRNASAFKKEK